MSTETGYFHTRELDALDRATRALRQLADAVAEFRASVAAAEDEGRFVRITLASPRSQRQPEAAPIEASSSMPAPAWLTVREAAEHLRMSRESFYKIMRETQLPRHRIGGRTLLNRIELDKWALAQGGETL